MIFFTAKLPIRRIILGLCVIGATVWGVYVLSTNKADNAGVFLKDEAGDVMTLSAKGMKTQADRLSYLESLGWKLDRETATTKTVQIPKEFNSAYEEYNQLQQKQDFDLCRYKGKKVELTSVKITNYPDIPDHVMANVLVYKGRVIGGDVCQETEDGFIQGLAEGLSS